MLHIGFSLAQNSRRIPRAINQVAKMVLQRLLIAALLHILEDLHHNARVPLCIQVDFLVVGNLADLAVAISS